MRVTTHEGDGGRQVHADTHDDVEIVVRDGGRRVVLRATSDDFPGRALDVQLDWSELNDLLVAGIKAQAERLGVTTNEAARTMCVESARASLPRELPST